MHRPFIEGHADVWVKEKDQSPGLYIIFNGRDAVQRHRLSCLKLLLGMVPGRGERQERM
jgi:hypothetical protein